METFWQWTANFSWLFCSFLTWGWKSDIFFFFKERPAPHHRYHGLILKVKSPHLWVQVFLWNRILLPQICVPLTLFNWKKKKKVKDKGCGNCRMNSRQGRWRKSASEEGVLEMTSWLSHSARRSVRAGSEGKEIPCRTQTFCPYLPDNSIFFPNKD